MIVIKICKHDLCISPQLHIIIRFRKRYQLYISIFNTNRIKRLYILIIKFMS